MGLLTELFTDKVSLSDGGHADGVMVGKPGGDKAFRKETKPEIKDGDGDGYIYDGTKHERPVGAGSKPEGDDKAVSVPQTETAEFKAWFGDSKVVDEDGEPLVVYHGTDEAFTTFSSERLGESTQAVSASNGFFFTDDAVTADSYARYAATDARVAELIRDAEKAERAGNWDLYDKKIVEAEALEHKHRNEKYGTFGGQNIKPVFLKLENPIEIDAGGEYFTAISEDINDAIYDAMDGGHDGVIIRNLDDAAGLSNRVADHFVVFEPSHIKSAIGNSGAFDSNDPDIRKSLNKAFRKSAKGTDGDGDGMIYDGTPDERPVTTVKQAKQDLKSTARSLKQRGKKQAKEIASQQAEQVQFVSVGEAQRLFEKANASTEERFRVSWADFTEWNYDDLSPNLDDVQDSMSSQLRELSSTLSDEWQVARDAAFSGLSDDDQETVDFGDDTLDFFDPDDMHELFSDRVQKRSKKHYRDKKPSTGEKTAETI